MHNISSPCTHGVAAGDPDYVVNAGALEYMARQGLPKVKLAVLETQGGGFATKAQWQAHLKGLGITGPRHVQIATEGALMGSLLAHGFAPDMAIMSDDAGQFNVFAHALCWIHAERGINRLIPLNEAHRRAQSWIRRQMWNVYADIKAYQAAPTAVLKAKISADFDALCATQYPCYWVDPDWPDYGASAGNECTGSDAASGRTPEHG